MSSVIVTDASLNVHLNIAPDRGSKAPCRVVAVKTQRCDTVMTGCLKLKGVYRGHCSQEDHIPTIMCQQGAVIEQWKQPTIGYRTLSGS